MGRFAIVGERAVVEGGIGPAAIVVNGDVIEAVCKPSEVPPDLPAIDVGDHVIMPGMVDCHVHVNEPGRTDWEGFATATRAAAAGGVCTIVDMPLNSIPVTTTAQAVQEKLRACTDQLWVDVALWGGVVPGNADALEGLAAAGVLGCKAFLIDSGIPEFAHVSPADLRIAMPRLRRLGLPLLVHAELDVGAAVTTASPRSYQHFLESRPPTWEVAAIELMIELCRETGCAVHIVHLSAADALPAIEAAKAEGLPLSVETCAHYLCLHAEGVPDGDTRYKCAPPIRGRDNQERLWNGLRTGAIDFVVTDHSPCTPALKRLDDGDFDRAWGGIASLQLGLPSIWTAARARRFDVAVLTRWLCSGPARFAGLGHRKGELRRGYEADITVWDDRAEFEVSSELLEFRHKVSPYVGRRLCGRVVDTWVRGHRVYHRGQIEGRPIGRPVLHREENLP